MLSAYLLSLQFNLLFTISHLHIMIHLITGGQKSGKSEYAESLILQLSKNPIYLATSRIWDDKHREKIRIHQQRRGDQWTNIEEEKQISKHDFKNRYVLLDCITLWLTNFFFDNGNNDNLTLEQCKAELNQLFSQQCNLIIVTNELGMGGYPANEVSARFNDLQGKINQYIAQKADKVTLVVSGIPVEIKPSR